MSLAYHRLPASAFDVLAAGGGAAAIGLLRRSQYSKHVLLLRGIGEHAPAAYDLLARAQRRDPGAVGAVVRYPAVGAWAYRTTLALRGGPRRPGACADGLGNIAAAAAIRAGEPGEIPVSAVDGRVVLPSLGAVDVGAGAGVATVRITPDGARVRIAGGHVDIPARYREAAAGWRPLRPVLPAAGEMAGILLDDIDPFRMPAAAHTAVAPDLSTWRPAFAGAWDLLRQHHPRVAAEVAAVIAVAVPLATPPHGQVSSSAPEAFGAVAMSEPADARGLALTLAHEVQHMKLSAVLDLVSLTHADDGSRYYAPWREDPRPASGLLQGTYAHLGVTGFWRRQRAADAVGDADAVADTEFARWREATAVGCGTLLASGQLTRDGERFVATMSATLRRWLDEPVPGPARRLATAENERHRARWEDRHGPVLVLPAFSPALPR
ncbi:MAG TPA: HEXXH motif domain-containing protein [Trebonia sp.]|nr:HEXXH motif domain-containing protein [Trebonia sp.]